MASSDGRSPSDTHPRRSRRAGMGRLLQGWWRRPRTSDAATYAPLPANPVPPAADQVEVDLVDQAEAFQSLRVSDVMTPRADIVALEISTPLAEVMRAFVDSEHSRMPVYRDTLDDPVGVVHIKDMLKLIAPADVAPESAPQPLWRDPILHRLRREVLYVPASMRTADLLLRMRVQRIHMALVIDEFGGTDGLVTLEDLIEAVVGEISDEHDEASTPEIVRRPGALLEADARAPLDELEALLGLSLSPPDHDEEIDTVAGLVATLAGRVPQRGEVIVHPAGFEFEVMEADPRRIRRLRIRPRAPLIDGVAAPMREAEAEPAAETPAVAQTPVKSVFLPDDRTAGQD